MNSSRGSNYYEKKPKFNYRIKQKNLKKNRSTVYKILKQ